MNSKLSISEKYAHFINTILKTLEQERGKWVIPAPTQALRSHGACPITHIWGRPDQKRAEYYMRAARNAGMPEDLQNTIVQAADNSNFSSSIPRDSVTLLRELMLDAAGLIEEKA